eukprot:403371097
MERRQIDQICKLEDKMKKLQLENQKLREQVTDLKKLDSGAQSLSYQEISQDFQKQIERLQKDLVDLKSSEQKVKLLLHEKNEIVRKLTVDFNDKISSKDKQLDILVKTKTRSETQMVKLQKQNQSLLSQLQRALSFPSQSPNISTTHQSQNEINLSQENINISMSAQQSQISLNIQNRPLKSISANTRKSLNVLDIKKSKSPNLTRITPTPQNITTININQRFKNKSLNRGDLRPSELIEVSKSVIGLQRNTRDSLNNLSLSNQKDLVALPSIFTKQHQQNHLDSMNQQQSAYEQLNNRVGQIRKQKYKVIDNKLQSHSVMETERNKGYLNIESGQNPQTDMLLEGEEELEHILSQNPLVIAENEDKIYSKTQDHRTEDNRMNDDNLIENAKNDQDMDRFIELDMKKQRSDSSKSSNVMINYQPQINLAVVDPNANQEEGVLQNQRQSPKKNKYSSNSLKSNQLLTKNTANSSVITNNIAHLNSGINNAQMNSYHIRKITLDEEIIQEEEDFYRQNSMLSSNDERKQMNL